MIKKKTQTPRRQRESYRGTSLIVRATAEGALGKAWSEGRELAALSGDNEQAVLAALRVAVDALITVETGPGTVDYPDSAAYLAALSQHPGQPTEKMRLMLTAHLKARDRTANGADLAAAGGYPGWPSARQQYAVLGRFLAEAMMFQPRDRVPGSPLWLLMIADCDEPANTGRDVLWTLREALATALTGSKFLQP